MDEVEVPDNLKCSICLETYNEGDQRPMGLGCGHSVCQSCSRRTQSCPKCRQVFTASTVNYDLLGVLEQYLKLKAENDANTQLNAQAVNNLRRMERDRNNAHSLLVEAKRKQLLDEQKAHEARDLERAIAQSLLEEEKRKNHENETIDKTKLFITGIPSWVSVDEIHKWIFEFNPNLQNGKSGISLRKNGDKQTCLASFTNDNEPTKIITKFHNQLYPGSDHELFIYHHRPKQQNRTQQNDIQKRPNETPKTNDEVDLFILGLPQKVNETDVTVIIFRNSPNLLTHSISLKPVGSLQSCKATVKSRIFATLVMSEWNGKNYPGSKSFIKIDFFKPPNRPRDPSRGRATQQLSRPVPRLTPSPTSPIYPPRQHRQDNFQPPQMFYAQQQYQQVLAPNHFAERAETHQFAPTFNSGLPTPQQLHKVLVSGLPADTQIDDLVTAFHPICKIALDFDLNPRIEMYSDTEDRFIGIASVAFQTRDAAQIIVHLFNNTQFGSTNNVINVKLYG